ncbi:MAG TPA: ATP-binding protein [Gammaproteobacteria bacterium]|nr:ATP-binding protein [Gammaproteobacteria bacterium]
MKPVPQSLFGRLVLVLVVGLILAQALSAAFNLRERAQAIERVSGLRWAQRAADAIHILDTLSPAQRPRVSAILSSRRWRIEPADQPPVEAPGPATVPEVRELRAGLRELLGPGRNFIVQAMETPHESPGFAPLRWLIGRQHPPAVRIEAQLRDGAWVRIAQRRPNFPAHWPHGLLVKLVVLFCAVLLLALLAVTWITRPLSVLAKAALKLGQDIHRPPLAETGPREVRRAARAFNAMQARLVRYIDSRVQLFTAISHDLKTPITRLRLRAELLDDPALREKITQDVAEMESMVGATLAFLRDADAYEAARPVDINALLHSLQADAEDLGRPVSVTGRAAATYTAQPQALRRCVTNLIDNALRYGGSAAITVEDGPERLVIRARDRGPGIPADQLERVMEPFYRVDNSRSRDTGSTGLGLAIAQNIAQAHGGTLMLRNHPEGGLEATLALPRDAGSRLE